MKNYLSKVLFLTFSLIPVSAFAQTSLPDPSILGNFITDINKTIVATLATLFIACAVAIFFFGIARFILASREGDVKEIENGKRFMFWGVIGLFVMFSIYGIILFGQNVLGIQGKTNIAIPTFQISGSTATQNGTPTTAGASSLPTAAGCPNAGQVRISGGTTCVTPGIACDSTGGRWSAGGVCVGGTSGTTNSSATSNNGCMVSGQVVSTDGYGCVTPNVTMCFNSAGRASVYGADGVCK